jgi:hypothetical protein
LIFEVNSEQLKVDHQVQSLNNDQFSKKLNVSLDVETFSIGGINEKG